MLVDADGSGWIGKVAERFRVGDGWEVYEEVSWDLQADCMLRDGEVRVRIKPSVTRRLRETYGD